METVTGGLHLFLSLDLQASKLLHGLQTSEAKGAGKHFHEQLTLLSSLLPFFYQMDYTFSATIISVHWKSSWSDDLIRVDINIDVNKHPLVGSEDICFTIPQTKAVIYLSKAKKEKKIK